MEKAIRACIDNGKRLLNEAELLEFEKPPATLFFLSLIAQEEFAKGFLLYLVTVGIIPWNSHILRATRDHKCKQLICIVMDFLCPDDDKRMNEVFNAVMKGTSPDFPNKVADAMDLLRHEKIGRWQSKYSWWTEDPNWDPEARKVSEGYIDRAKQDSLYVRLDKNGCVASTPKNINENLAKDEYERARRFERFIEDLEKLKRPTNIDYENVENAFKRLFTEQTAVEN